MAEATMVTAGELHTGASKEGNTKTTQRFHPGTRPNAWTGKNKAKEFNVQSIRERTFQMRPPSNFSGKDVIISINGIIQKEEIETVSQQRTGGNWTILTRMTEAANKMVLNNLLEIRPERELYRIQPRLPRSTLLMPHMWIQRYIILRFSITSPITVMSQE